VTVHTYRKPDAARCVEDRPRIEDFRFNDALDVVEWAERDATIGWSTWPDVWHLDDCGRFCCYFKASSLDSIRHWAKDPSGLYKSRAEGLAAGDCPDRWLIVESRQAPFFGESIADERDVRAFCQVRQHLAEVEVNLVDTVIFDDNGHWWSMHELTSGTTRWS
jgi:hypothetical protein